MSLKLPESLLKTPEPPKKETGGKKQAPPPTEGSDLKTILAALKKEKGEKVIVRANTIPPIRRLPTGLFELDYYLGGGFPMGRYSIVYGPESSNKTNIALKATAQAQRLPPPCNKVVWVNVEQSFDPLWAEVLGVDIANLEVANGAYGEENSDLIDAVLRADDVALVVVDSVASLISNKEIAKSAEDYDIGTSALLIKRLVNKMMVAFGEEAKLGHYPCVLLINQTRFKPGVIMGDPETMPGGEAQKFLSSLRIRCYAKNEIDKASKLTMFKDTKVVVKKSKVPIRAMDFNFKMCVYPHDGLAVGDTDSFNQVKGLLQSLGMLTKVPKGYHLKTTTIDDIYPTIGAMQDAYRMYKDFSMKLQAEITNMHSPTMLVDEPSGPAYVPPGQAQMIADLEETA